MFADPYECVRGADAVVVVTEWPQFRELDWTRVARMVRRHVIVDGRNCLDADAVVAAGFTYISMGRATRRPSTKAGVAVEKQAPAPPLVSIASE